MMYNYNIFRILNSQRKIKVKFFWIFIFLSVFTSLALAQDTAKGIVFHDINENGKMDRKEQGISGVVVSNGVDVVQTDVNGYYQISVGKDNIIFVVKPTGYRYPKDKNNLPQFYYIHKPEGSPQESKYKGTAPTGMLPKSINFSLLSNVDETNFKTLVFGDPQPYNEKELEYFERGIISEVENIEGVSFGISLGDIVGNNLGLIPKYIDAVKKVGIPWYNVIGNHDLNFDAITDTLSDETFETFFGPTSYSFNVGQAHFVVLDNIIYPNPQTGKGYIGGLRESQFTFLENNLKLVDTSKLVVLAFHIPLEGSNFQKDHRERLFKILQRFPRVLALSAHTHRQQHFLYDQKDGWNGVNPLHEYNVGTTSGNWYSGEYDAEGIPYATMTDGTPKGYAFLNVEGKNYTLDYKVASMPGSYQMSVFMPKIVPHKEKTNAKIYVNFFMGAQNDKVEYRVGNGEWKQMSRVVEHDPSFLYLLHRWDFAEELMPGKRPGPARLSSHLWNTPIPTNLAVGTHRVEIKATDMFGRTFYGEGSYHIASPQQ